MNNFETDKLIDLITKNHSLTLERLEQMDLFIKEQVNNRLLTIEWLANDQKHKVDHLVKILDTLNRKQQLDCSIVQDFLADYPNYKFKCTQSIAVDSNDTQDPESTFEGAVPKPEFVNACERITKKQKLKFLDIGCGSGALVYDFLSKGHFAIGLDGSDGCKKFDVGFWNDITHLHTCDVTKVFSFVNDEEIEILFDVISMWEVFEHIQEKDCAAILSNIKQNLSDTGIFVGSISTLEYVNSETGVPYHVTIKDKEWWRHLFAENGLEFVESEFNFHEYCRGVGNRFQDPHSYRKSPSAGFHFVAKKSITSS